MLCKYKDVLGSPGVGVHKYKIMGVAVVDLLLTVVLAYLIHKIFKFGFIITLISLLVLGELLHWLFCVDTAVMKFLRKIFTK